MTIHERLKEIMKPATVYTWGQIMKGIGGQSTVAERMIQDAECAGYIQECMPIDGVNRSFKLVQ